MTSNSSAPPVWHILTGEYPPAMGGVGDYVAQVSDALARKGICCQIWTGGDDPLGTPDIQESGVRVHRIAGRFDRRGLSRLSRALRQQSSPRELFVNYVPHSYGRLGINLAFALWVWRQAWFRRDRIHVLFHEVSIPFSRNSWRQNVVAGIHHLMAWILLITATRVSVSTAAWIPRLRALGMDHRRVSVLPIPSSLPRRSREFRSDSTGTVMVGHFGTYGAEIQRMLLAVLPGVLEQCPQAKLVLLGRGSAEFAREFQRMTGIPDERLSAGGALPREPLADALSRCDVMFQPYPDGATTRRSSLMACLSLGCATVTTYGELTEDLWREGAITPIADAARPDDQLELVLKLCNDPLLRTTASEQGQTEYDRQLSLEVSLRRLLGDVDVTEPASAFAAGLESRASC